MIKSVLLMSLAFSVGPAFSAEKSKIAQYFSNKKDGIYYSHTGDHTSSYILEFGACEGATNFSCLSNEADKYKNSWPKYNVRGKFFIIFNGTARNTNGELTGPSVLAKRSDQNAALLLRLTTTTKNSIPKLAEDRDYISLERKDLQNNCSRGKLQEGHSQQRFMDRANYIRGIQGTKSNNTVQMRKFHFTYKLTDGDKCQYTLDRVVDNDNIDVSGDNQNRKAIVFLGKKELDSVNVPSNAVQLVGSVTPGSPAIAYPKNDKLHDSELATLTYLKPRDNYFSFSAPIVTVPIDHSFTPKNNKPIFTAKWWLSSLSKKNQFRNEKYSDEKWVPKTSTLTLHPINSMRDTKGQIIFLSTYKIWWNKDDH